MQKALIGKKIGMTQIFDEKGNVIPVTVVEAGPCNVVMKKTIENDGYEAVQLGFGDVKVQRVSKPMMGHFKKNDVAPKKTLKEFKFDDMDSVNVGDTITADIFAAGDKVDVVGTSKGHGTAGAIKRWNFSRLKESHGTGPVARHAGSLGACSDPSRVYKGKKLAGHLGCERVTIQNLTVAKIDAENNLVAIKGAIPGPKGGIVVIRDSINIRIGQGAVALYVHLEEGIREVYIQESLIVFLHDRQLCTVRRCMRPGLEPLRLRNLRHHFPSAGERGVHGVIAVAVHTSSIRKLLIVAYAEGALIKIVDLIKTAWDLTEKRPTAGYIRYTFAQLPVAEKARVAGISMKIRAVFGVHLGLGLRNGLLAPEKRTAAAQA